MFALFLILVFFTRCRFLKKKKHNPKTETEVPNFKASFIQIRWIPIPAFIVLGPLSGN